MSVAESYIQGASTRRMEDLVRSFGLNSLSASEVSRLCSKEMKRRSRPVGAFPSDRSLLRLAGCIMININEGWITGKRYLSMDEE